MEPFYWIESRTSINTSPAMGKVPETFTLQSTQGNVQGGGLSCATSAVRHRASVFEVISEGPSDLYSKLWLFNERTVTTCLKMEPKTSHIQTSYHSGLV